MDEKMFRRNIWERISLLCGAAADPEETQFSWRKALQRAYEFGKNIYGTCDGQ